ncbi:MAG: hypothetical protein WBX25_32705 [Rhodomicrobium sp.]
MPTTFLHGRKTFGDAAKTIIKGLEKAGYLKRNFFCLENNGIALVTHLEKINEDGTPARNDGRWPPILEPLDYRFNANLDAVLHGLFEAEAGHYRVIVFFLSSFPPTPSAKEVAGVEAVAWLKSDGTTLPNYIAAQPLEEAVVVALIYEFESDGSRVKVIHSPISGQAHLSKAGILASLGAS